VRADPPPVSRRSAATARADEQRPAHASRTTDASEDEPRRLVPAWLLGGLGATTLVALLVFVFGRRPRA
jgi:hypothetical protein